MSTKIAKPSFKRLGTPSRLKIFLSIRKNMNDFQLSLNSSFSFFQTPYQLCYSSCVLFCLQHEISITTNVAMKLYYEEVPNIEIVLQWSYKKIWSKCEKIIIIHSTNICLYLIICLVLIFFQKSKFITTWIQYLRCSRINNLNVGILTCDLKAKACPIQTMA
jgi:hypothetical protein